MTLTDLLAYHRVEHRVHGEHHHVGEGWVGIDCHRCSPGSGKFRLGINLQTHAASCWQCGRLSTADAVVQATGKPWGELLDAVRRAERPTASAQKSGRLAMREGCQELTHAHKIYLRGRRFDPEAVVRVWRVQATGQGGVPPWSLVIPIHLGNRVVSWTARSISERGRRYYTARDDQSAAPPKSLLYGADFAAGSVIVHEGPLDVWRTGPGAVATLGLSYTDAQVRLLANYGKRVVCFDSEPGAQRRAKALCRRLKAFGGETVNVCLDADDAAAASDREIQLLRKEL